MKIRLKTRNEIKRNETLTGFVTLGTTDPYFMIIIIVFNKLSHPKCGNLNERPDH